MPGTASLAKDATRATAGPSHDVLARFLYEKFKREIGVLSGQSVGAPEKTWKPTKIPLVDEILQGHQSGGLIDQYATAAGILATAYLNPSESLYNLVAKS